jgi:hypothetical protein
MAEFKAKPPTTPNEGTQQPERQVKEFLEGTKNPNPPTEIQRSQHLPAEILNGRAETMIFLIHLVHPQMMMVMDADTTTAHVRRLRSIRINCNIKYAFATVYQRFNLLAPQILTTQAVIFKMEIAWQRGAGYGQ